MFNGKDITSLENELFKKIGFKIMYNQATKEFLAEKIEEFIPETGQLIYIKSIMKTLHEKSWTGGDYHYSPDFNIRYVGAERSIDFTEKT